MLQTTWLSKNLWLLIDMAKSDKVDIMSDGSDYKNETIEKSLSKKSNGTKNYWNLKARLAFIQMKKAFIKALIF